MTISLTPEKREKILRLREQVLGTKCTIRTLASLIGNLVASFPAVVHGPLFYRHLEIDKSASLKIAEGNFFRPASLSEKSINEIKWWIKNIRNSFTNIVMPEVDITIHTDASLIGWGITDDITQSGGQWLPDEIEHINVLELRAAYFGILAYCKNRNFRHVRVMMDNITAIAYINKKGGCKSIKCNNIAKYIWVWCMEHNLHVSAAHIPGVDNIVADKKSREFSDSTEWQLNPILFNKICNRFGTPDIDLFDSRLNTQLQIYVSWHPEANSHAIDAFSIVWDFNLCYIFPPFSLVGRVLAKVRRDSAEAIIVVPDWPTQTWYPQVKSMAISPPLALDPHSTNFAAPTPTITHTSTQQEVETTGSEDTRKTTLNVTDILLASRRPSTRSKV